MRNRQGAEIEQSFQFLSFSSSLDIQQKLSKLEHPSKPSTTVLFSLFI
jgi:hypothetical protein